MAATPVQVCSSRSRAPRWLPPGPPSRLEGRRGRDVDLSERPGAKERISMTQPACVERLQAGASRLALARSGQLRPPAPTRCTTAAPSIMWSEGVVERAQTSRTTTCSYDRLGHRASCAGAGVLCGEDARSRRVCGCDRRGRGCSRADNTHQGRSVRSRSAIARFWSWACSAPRAALCDCGW